jgi:methyl-accepting chemotaxis protein
MKWFYNLKIAAKLITGFIMVAIISGIIGIAGIANITKINNNDTILYEKMTVPISQLAQISELYQRQRVILRDIIIIPNVEDKKKEVENINGKDKEIEKLSTEFEKKFTDLDDSERALFEEYKKALSNYLPYRDKVIQIALTENTAGATSALRSQDSDKAEMAVQDTLTKLVSENVENARIQSENNDNTASGSITFMIIFIAIGAIVSIGSGLFISRTISNPVKQIAMAADKLALGDINITSSIDRKDEVGSLAKSFERMIETIRNQALAAQKIAEGDLTVEIEVKSENDLLGKKLSQMVQNNNEVLSDIACAAEQVTAGSRQISDASIALSQGATEQASSVEELTASLEEIATQTKLNAENANQANELSENAKSNAIKGNNQMKDMLTAMEEINESSANISKIIKVIDDIAFQTNILALNAAVEAARAGQHGKGFAVVAEEVRNLAARSANAAKETTDLIEGSIRKAEGGTRIAKETAVALDKIVDEIEKVANIVSNITIASNEQAMGIEQVNQGIMQVSQVVQTNSATSQESAAASEELASQAVVLQETVTKFKLRQNTRNYEKFDNLSPEILRMLENMTEKKKVNTDSVEKSSPDAVTAKSKIVLSDNEFGKY